MQTAVNHAIDTEEHLLTVAEYGVHPGRLATRSPGRRSVRAVIWHHSCRGSRTSCRFPSSLQPRPSSHWPGVPRWRRRKTPSSRSRAAARARASAVLRIAAGRWRRRGPGTARRRCVDLRGLPVRCDQPAAHAQETLPAARGAPRCRHVPPGTGRRVFSAGGHPRAGCRDAVGAPTGSSARRIRAAARRVAGRRARGRRPTSLPPSCRHRRHYRNKSLRRQ